MKIVLCSSLILTAALGVKPNAETKTYNKNVTVVSAESSADGGSEISRETVKECVESLPTPASLEAEVKSESRYLKEVNGDPSKNEWAKAYTASVTINYMLYRKELLIVTVRSVQGMAPVMKEVEKRLQQSRAFTSNPDDGSTYAGRSNRRYYFARAEDAVSDVKARAAVWLKQQAPVVCGK